MATKCTLVNARSFRDGRREAESYLDEEYRYNVGGLTSAVVLPTGKIRQISIIRI